MSTEKRPTGRMDHALNTKARKELNRMLYHPRSSSDPDDSLRLVNDILRPPRPLKHADVDLISEEEVTLLIEKLKLTLRDRREATLASIRRMICDPII